MASVFASVRLGQSLALLGAAAAGAIVFYLLQRLMRRGPRVPRWLAPLGIASGTAAAAVGVGVLVPSQPEAQKFWAQVISAGVLGGLLWAIYLTGRRRPEAAKGLEVKRPGAEVTVSKGVVVDPTEAARPEAQGKVEARRVALEDFEFEQDGADHGVAKGQEVDEALSRRPEAEGKVALVFTACESFTYTPMEKTTYVKGAEVPEELLDDPGLRGEIVRRRRFFLRALVVGKDGRWSTSKLQAVLWTAAILYALLAIVIAVLGLGLDLELFGEPTQKDGSPWDLGDLPLPDEYYLLLGGPFAAAIAARAITAAKVESGTLVKPDAESPPTAKEGLAEVVSNDDGSASLLDAQYFTFNLLTLGVFLYLFATTLESGFPKLPEALFGLTSASALAYVTKKAAERSTPTVTAVSPTTVRPGATVEVWGKHLVAQGRLPRITASGKAVGSVTDLADALEGGDHLQVALPRDLEGTAALVVTPAGGSPSSPVTLTVEGLAITSVEPEPIPIETGRRVIVTGTGFGADAGTLALESQPLEVVSWRPTLIVGRLGDAAGYDVGSALPLQVSVGDQVAVRLTRATVFEVEAVTPTPIPGKAGQQVSVTGSGLGAVESLWIGRLKLDILAQSDSHIAGRLGREAEHDEVGKRTLVLADDSGHDVRIDVRIKKAT